MPIISSDQWKATRRFTTPRRRFSRIERITTSGGRWGQLPGLALGRDVGIANFESLTVSMQKQAVHGLTFLAGYRWSKCMDESEEAFFDADAYSTPNPRSDYGPCSFNVTGQFKGSFVWDLPQVKFGPAVVHHILDNWEVNGILMLQDGQPFSVLSGVDNSTSGIGMDRADQIGNPSLPKHRSHAQEAREFFNTAAFRENAPGTYGETPRDYLSGPDMKTSTSPWCVPSPSRWAGRNRRHCRSGPSHSISPTGSTLPIPRRLYRQKHMERSRQPILREFSNSR